MKENRRITFRVFGDFSNEDISEIIKYLPETGIVAWNNGWMVSKEDDRKSEVYTIWKKGNLT